MKTLLSHHASRIFLFFLLAVMSSPSVFGGGYEAGLPRNIETEVQARPTKVKKGRLKALVSSMRSKQQRRAVIKGLWRAIKDEGGSNLGTWALILVSGGITVLLISFIVSVAALFWVGVLAILVGVIMGLSAGESDNGRTDNNGSDKKAGSVAAGIGITTLVVLLVIFALAAILLISLILEALGDL